MSIIRVKHTQFFTVVPNETIRDPRLSISALGVLCRLLSRPCGWQVRPEPLASECRIGRDQLRKIFRELEEAGYLSRKKRAENGRWVWDCEVRDTPTIAWKSGDGFSGDKESTENESTEKDIKTTGAQRQVVPASPGGFPPSAQPSSQTYSAKTKRRAEPEQKQKLQPGAHDPQFYQLWATFPRRLDHNRHAPQLRAEAWGQWRRLLDEGVNPDDLLQAARAWRESEEIRASTKGANPWATLGLLSFLGAPGSDYEGDGAWPDFLPRS